MFARIWGRRPYGPHYEDSWRLAVHTLMAARYSHIGAGNLHNSSLFQGFPSANGLWLYYNPDSEDYEAR